MSDRAELSLEQLCQSLEASLSEANDTDRSVLEEELAWCRIEKGELGSAFELLWGSPARDGDASGRRFLRAELQAFCGNEEAALSLLKDGSNQSLAGALVRCRVAAARGDWPEVSRWASEARGGDTAIRARAVLLWARALVESDQSRAACELLDSNPAGSSIDALERGLLRAHASERPLEALRSFLDRAEAARAVRLSADAWADITLVHRDLGEPDEERTAAVRAVELWDDMATSLPPPLRVGFWCDARRETIRTASKRKKAATAPRPGLAQILENLGALASERNLAKLLNLITDGAVSLSGAERGFVLLTNSDGALEPETIRSAEDQLGPDTTAFSRSIAETVLIDGEPVITVDASHDARVQDFLSVHQLMLKSVACLPIATRGRTWGVLYLEHRSRSGRFSGTDLSLLRSYADQAAIAIETSRLFEQINSQKRDLEATNDALRDANHQLQHRVQGQTQALQRSRLELDRLQISKSMGRRWGLIGVSEAMLRVYELLDRLATTDVPVMITGESGTGKELVARAIHKSGQRADQPFVTLHCGAIPEELLESELFGHTAGAFTGAVRARDGVFVQAENGTLFMDEIADMAPRMQLDLLRVLQEGRVRPLGEDKDRAIDVRLVTASKRSLLQLVKEEKIREDLYYRIAVVELLLPPLRDRMEDVPLLCEHFLARVADERAAPQKILSRNALQRLRTHTFPGNVRELEHILLNAGVFAAGTTIEAEELTIEAATSSPAPKDNADTFTNFKATERNRILSTLNAHDWNRARAARALGMARRTFYRRLKEHGIELPKG